MSRRAFLSAIGAASPGLSGCLGSSNSPEKVEYEEDDDCQLVLDVSYHLFYPFLSHEEDRRLRYIDAEEADLRENEYLAQVLSEARERYEERKDEVNGSTRERALTLLRDRALADSSEVQDKSIRATHGSNRCVIAREPAGSGGSDRAIDPA